MTKNMKINNFNINLTPELAEIAGIHAGDGYLRYEGRRKEFDVSGGYEEKTYYDNHVIPLFNKVFELSIKGKYFPSRRTYGFVIRERKILEVFKKLGFPSGSKSLSVKIPETIIKSNNKEIIQYFLRGFFDTDGCINFRNRKGGKTYSEFKQKYHYHPRIHLTTVSNSLCDNLTTILKKLGFRFYTHTMKNKQKNWNDTHRIFISGESNLLKWMGSIGTKNPTKLSRYQIWEKYGFCPSNTTYDQRINILSGKLDPYLLYGPVA